MTFAALLAEFEKEYSRIADFAAGLSADQLNRKAHVPLLKKPLWANTLPWPNGSPPWWIIMSGFTSTTCEKSGSIGGVNTRNRIRCDRHLNNLTLRSFP